MRKIKFLYRGLELGIDDYIVIEITQNVLISGKIIFEDGSYCISYPNFGSIKTTPLSSFSKTCKITKLNEV